VVYLSGNAARLPKAVREALVEVVQLKGGGGGTNESGTNEDIQKFLDGLEKSRRFQMECWE
jgi:sulfite reductase alpha subunit-like flavoprotein